MNKEIISYLSTLDADTLHRTIKGMNMVEKAESIQANCDGVPCPDGTVENPTANGSWVCLDKKCTWIPEIG